MHFNHRPAGHRSEKEPAHHTRPAWVMLLCLSLCLAPALSGCGGCSDDGSTKKTAAQKKKEAEEKKKKAKKKPKPNFQLKRFAVQPNDLLDRNGFAKPGHWSSATVDAIANNFDVRGEMTTDAQDIAGVPYRVGTSRPAILPKGQRRNFEVMFQVPPRSTGRPTFARLTYNREGRDLISQPGGLQRMPSYQFFGMVLAKQQDRYQYLQFTPAFHSLRDTMGGGSSSYFYLLQLPPVIRQVPLPSSSLAWTNTAFIIWDDMTDDVFREEQRTAMIDWLHWGGQLVVSGPGSLEMLKNSFLSDYLPAESTGNVELDADQLRQWHFVRGNGRYAAWPRFRGPKPNKPWPCEQLKLKHPDDTVLVRTGADEDSVPLVVERQVGRGRVVVTAFRMTQPELADWRLRFPDFDMFLNSCLLRRPGRQYTWDPGGSVTFKWLDGGNSAAETASKVSGMSYFSRDTGPEKHQPSWLQSELYGRNEYQQYGPPGSYDPDFVYRQYGGAGVCGWDDWNDVSETARTSLNEAAGIKVPDRMFIVQVMAIYLMILVPANWLIFRVLGRLEWAWIAVPIITIGFAIAVVKLAEVNIGFARARTEVNVVEVHQGYDRAHLTRYTALYTSLSTSYSVKVEDRTGLVLPLADREQLAAWQGRSTLWLHRDKEVQLDGFNVASNSMGILHAEQMMDLGGPIDLVKVTGSRVTVRNDSKYRLEDAEVIGPNGVAWLGNIEPGDEASGEFGALPEREPEDVAIEQLETVPPNPFEGDPVDDEGNPIDQRRPLLDRIPLSSMLKLAHNVPTGELRLVARSNEEIPGLSITPASSQRRSGNVFVVHLKAGNRRAPQADGPITADIRNILDSIKPPRNDDEDSEDPENNKVNQ